MADTRHKPAFRIVANGDDITAVIKDRFISLTISDEAGMQSDSLDLTLDDSRPHIGLPSTGAELAVWLGYGDKARYMGLYVVDEVSLSWPPHKLTIRAAGAPFEQSAAYKELQTQRTRSWTPRTVAELVQTIAAEHGLEAAVGAEVGSIVLPHVDQMNESDMNLLTRLADSLDAIAKANAGKLLFVKKGRGTTATGKQMPTVRLVPKDITNGSVHISDRTNYRSVVATWRDVQAARDVQETAGSGTPEFRIRHTYPTQDAAQKAAHAKLEAFQRGKRTLSLTLPGNPKIGAEARLALDGFRDGIAGTWSVTKAVHTLGGGGLVTQVEGEVV